MDDKKNNDSFDVSDYEFYLQNQSEQETPPEPKEEQNMKKNSSKSKKRKNKKRKVRLKPAAYVVLILFAAIVVCGAVGAKKLISHLKQPDPPAPVQTVATVRITFPEGYTVLQMGELLEKNGVCSKSDFYAAANTSAEGINIENPQDRMFLLEGYLFADTYDFYVGEDASSVVKRFTDNFKEKITPEFEQRASELGYSLDEMLSLASIIQKECDEDIEECKNVSSVFHNRLKQNRKGYLGSDVTYFYLKNALDYIGGKENPRYETLLNNYYTYSPYRKGLPAGPICNPSLKAIEAALYPNDTDYYFFLTDESCKNFFYAETYEQHLKNGREAGIMD